MTPKQIAKALGVTETGLKLLVRASVQRDSRASGAGFGHGSGAARAALAKLGLVDNGERDCGGDAKITDAGRTLVLRARTLGF